MDKRNFISSVLSLFPNDEFSSIQIQKLFFLISKEVSNIDACTQCNFKPHNYGPYSYELSSFLQDLLASGIIKLNIKNEVNHYSISQLQSTDNLNIAEIQSKWAAIKDLDFKALCFYIYEKYSDMKVNSVFFK